MSNAHTAIATRQKLRFVDPKNDVAFKKIFGSDNHHEALIEFLNSVLDLPEPIESVRLRDPSQPPLVKGLKGTILDVYASSPNHQFMVEMQVESDAAFAKRIFYYISKAYVNQLDSGEDYALIKPVVFLGVMNFKYFKQDDDRPIRRHVVMDKKRHEQYFEEFDFNFIELPKFKKTEEELVTPTDKWLFFLKNASLHQEIPKWADSAGLKAAYEIAEKHRWTTDELELYDYWKKKEFIHLHALDKAKTEARIEARAEGKAEGRAEGRAEGELIKARQIARALLDKGLDIKSVSDATQLSITEIEQLIKKEPVS